MPRTAALGWRSSSLVILSGPPQWAEQHTGLCRVRRKIAARYFPNLLAPLPPYRDNGRLCLAWLAPATGTRPARLVNLYFFRALPPLVSHPSDFSATTDSTCPI